MIHLFRPYVTSSSFILDLWHIIVFIGSFVYYFKFLTNFVDFGGKKAAKQETVHFPTVTANPLF